MAITIVRRSSKRAIQEAAANGARILDVTSNGPQPWIRFSPFYPHGNIPVPLSEGYFTYSVEGAWQALKAFKHEDIDLTKLRIHTMKGLKRSSARRGAVLGHRAGINGNRLLSYVEARKAIYLPLYKWVLDKKVQHLVMEIRTLSVDWPVVLLDYETNSDICDPSKPLSHAALIKLYVEGHWPAK